jgi:hypothetical protein
MNLKDKIRMELREAYGGFESYLEQRYEETIIEKIYEEKLTKRLNSEQRELKLAWLTYNNVIVELKHNLKDMLRVKELQYRLTDIENPNKVCIEVIKDVKQRSPELERLYDTIRNFNKL